MENFPGSSTVTSNPAQMILIQLSADQFLDQSMTFRVYQSFRSFSPNHSRIRFTIRAVSSWSISWSCFSRSCFCFR